ncbi:uncharacterized protein [Dipodomys merriami]|uniref:uncharacterized protein n=1 Tax=Dipodomys merriami TaxID=94247 RepID=UPI00385575BF
MAAMLTQQNVAQACKARGGGLEAHLGAGLPRTQAWPPAAPAPSEARGPAGQAPTPPPPRALHRWMLTTSKGRSTDSRLHARQGRKGGNSRSAASRGSTASETRKAGTGSGFTPDPGCRTCPAARGRGLLCQLLLPHTAAALVERRGEKGQRSPAMPPAAPGSLLLACSLAVVPFFTVSWELRLSDLEEKVVDEFSSSGFRCPTCLAVQGKKCDVELRWCAADKIKCVEFFGIINTGNNSNIVVEMKKCIPTSLCGGRITSYMGLPVANGSTVCKSAVRNAASPRHPAAGPRHPAAGFLLLVLEKLLH